MYGKHFLLQRGNSKPKKKESALAFGNFEMKNSLTRLVEGRDWASRFP